MTGELIAREQHEQDYMLTSKPRQKAFAKASFCSSAYKVELFCKEAPHALS